MHCALAMCKCTVQIEAYDYLLAWRAEQRPMADGVGPAGSHEFLGGVRVGEPVGGGSHEAVWGLDLPQAQAVVRGTGRHHSALTHHLQAAT